ncbi:hypothetical protein T492DRAFT_961455, partial [Pavlovales sp. CCMP2436]
VALGVRLALPSPLPTPDTTAAADTGRADIRKADTGRADTVRADTRRADTVRAGGGSTRWPADGTPPSTSTAVAAALRAFGREAESALAASPSSVESELRGWAEREGRAGAFAREAIAASAAAAAAAPAAAVAAATATAAAEGKAEEELLLKKDDEVSTVVDVEVVGDTSGEAVPETSAVAGTGAMAGAEVITTEAAVAAAAELEAEQAAALAVASARVLDSLERRLVGQRRAAAGGGRFAKAGGYETGGYATEGNGKRAGRQKGGKKELGGSEEWWRRWIKPDASDEGNGGPSGLSDLLDELNAFARLVGSGFFASVRTLKESAPAAESFGLAFIRGVRAAAKWVGAGVVGAPAVLALSAALSLAVGLARALAFIVLARLALELRRAERSGQGARPPGRKWRKGTQARGRSGLHGGWAQPKPPPPPPGDDIELSDSD